MPQCQSLVPLSQVMLFGIRAVMSKFIGYTAHIISSSLIVLLLQLIGVAILVFTGQGRAVLATAVPLGYVGVLIGAASFFYARSLAPPVTPTAVDANEETDRRLRWMALWSGSVIIALLSSLLLPCLLEFYVAAQASKLPDTVRSGLQPTAMIWVVLVAMALLGAIYWAYSSANSQTKRRLLLPALWTIVTIPIARWVWPAHSALLYAILNIVAWLLFPLWVFRGAPPPPMNGGPDKWAILSCVFFLTAGIILAIFPDVLMELGSAHALFIALLFWIAVVVGVDWLLRWGRERHPVAIFGMKCFLIAIGISFVYGFFDARSVREVMITGEPPPSFASAPQSSLAAGKPSNKPARQTLAEYVSNWLETRRGEISESRPYPVFLVAAAGGGLRASYWTAEILGALQDGDETFSRHVLGLSGVSGGSVGVGMFAALVKARCKPSLISAASQQLSPPCRRYAAKILKADFLAPTLYALLTRDVLTSIIPIDAPDRAAALEQAFERSWRNSMGNDVLERPLDELWRGDDTDRVPALFLNATEVGSAEHVVISPVSMVGVGRRVDSRRVDLVQAAVESRAFRLSTAMVLSSRFPYVTPEGIIEVTTVPVTQEDVVTAADKQHMLRLADGGFFDNSGTATIVDVLDVLDKSAMKAGLSKGIRPIVLIIENRPPPSPDDTVEDDVGGFTSPMILLNKIRMAHTATFKRELCRVAADRSNVAVLPIMRPNPGRSEFPLGWALSSPTRNDMDNQIIHPEGNNNLSMAAIWSALKGEYQPRGSACTP
jgi:hypothetical protein